MSDERQVPLAPPPPALEYDRSAGPFATRRALRLLMAFTLLNTVMLTALLLGLQPAPLVR